jgi:hypothetical protein
MIAIASILNELSIASLSKEVDIRNKRVQKLFTIFKEFIYDMILLEVDYDPSCTSVKYNLKKFWNFDRIDEEEASIYYEGFMELFGKDAKYLGIKRLGDKLFINFNKYQIRSGELFCMGSFMPEDKEELKEMIISDIKHFSKKYYDIKLN